MGNFTYMPFCQRIISIGNPVILAALRKIPRTETVDADYFNRNPETPRIGGGRAFNSVLEAIGMGILSAEHGLHAPFIQEMISTLTIRSIAEALAQEENSYKSWLAHVVKEETQLLLAHIKQAGESQQPFSPDFRIYALKVFLRGFYPNAFWEESWIQQLSQIIEETGRLYTTIYAQPGKALEDFTIEYLGKKVFVKAGDELHYTTWIANRDKMEWGESAAEFNPEKHQSHYTRLNPLATFGSGSRVCRGKSLTLAIIEYFTTQVLELTSWTAYVDGKTNYHPTELNFNNGVKGNITYTFQLRNQQVNSEEVRQWNEVSDASPGHNIHSMLSRKQKEKETIRTTPETQMVIAQMRL